MRKFTYLIFLTATVMALYCAYNQGVINERKRWQTSIEKCIDGKVVHIYNLNVIPPSNIRAKVK